MSENDKAPSTKIQWVTLLLKHKWFLFTVFGTIVFMAMVAVGIIPAEQAKGWFDSALNFGKEIVGR